MERTYVAGRIDAGLYIQPSNDGERLYVIARYEHEDEIGGAPPVKGWGWGPLTKAEGNRIERMAEHEPYEALNELRWLAEKNFGYKTKREAVDAALASAVAA